MDIDDIEKEQNQFILNFLRKMGSSHPRMRSLSSSPLTEVLKSRQIKKNDKNCLIYGDFEYLSFFPVEIDDF